MRAPSMKAVLGALVATPFLIAAGCGGSTGGGGAVGASNGTVCTMEGQKTYALDGCNTCVCQGGTWSCTTKSCTAGCTSGATTNDGCNTCSCSSGAWSCTRNACSGCVDGTTTNDGCNTCSCSNGMMMCTARACQPPPECPAPQQPPPGVACTTMVVYAKDPTTGACCQYGSGCNAPTGWTTYPSLAECQGTTTICTSGQTKPAGDGCNTCSCSNGNWLCTHLACAMDAGVPKICGGIAGFTCSTTEYCAYVEGQMCGAADASSTCQPRPDACDTVYAPVCGCDQQTYGNACEAARAGQGVYSSGQCPIPAL